EGDVGAHVGVAKAIVELDAVDHDGRARAPWPRGQEIDVLEPEVAVAVAHLPARHAVLEIAAALAQETELARLQLALDGLGGEAPEHVAGLREVLLHVARDGFEAPEAGDRLARRRRGVEARDGARERIEQGPAELPP